MSDTETNDDDEEFRLNELCGPLFDLWMRFEKAFARLAIDRLEVSDADAKAFAVIMERTDTDSGKARGTIDSGNEAFRQLRDRWAAERDALRAEVEKMRLVVAAADSWRDAIDDTDGPADGDGILGAAIALSEAVDAYRAIADTTKET